MTTSSWTPERKDKAEKLYREGQSCAQIARTLGKGLTRNAVIGMLNRMGVSKHGRPSAPAKADIVRSPAVRRPPARHVTTNGVFVEPGQASAPIPLPPPIRLMRDNSAGRPIPLFCEPVEFDALKRGQCEFPVTGTSPFMRCGADKAEVGPYCRGHRAFSYIGGTARPQKEKNAPQRQADYQRERQARASETPDVVEMFA